MVAPLTPSGVPVSRCGEDLLMSTLTTITDRLTLVMLNVNIWSGRKKLRPEDLQLPSGAIPPEELVSLGSKRICDPDQLKAFHRIKQAAERACLKVGTKFLGGFAVPHEQAADLATQLEVLQAEFSVATTDFSATYDQALHDWIASLPHFEAAIRCAIEPVAVVQTKLRFSYQMIEFAPAAQPGTLHQEVAALGDGIFGEVEQMARDLEEAFAGKDKLHRRALGTFTRIRDKLDGLAFVDPRIQPIIDSINDWLQRLPALGPITGGHFTEGMGLALLLAKSDQMARHGAGQWALRQGTAITPEEDETPEAPDEDVAGPPPLYPPPLPPASRPCLFF